MTKKALRIAILSQNKKLYSTQRLCEAAKAAGHKPIIVNPLRCYMDIKASDPTVHFEGKILSNIDVVIPRIAASSTIYGTALLRQFEVGGVYTVNSSVAVLRSRDKLRVHQLLAKNNLPIPRTSYAHSTECTDQLIEIVGGVPLIVKLTEGSQGKGVIKVDTPKEAKAVIDAFRDLNANLLVQEFIKEANGQDIRCFVVGGKIIASMMRVAAPGDFRANLHTGGTAQKVRLTAEEKTLALRVAKIVGLEVAGVDIIRSARGPLVLEINSSPGLEGIEGCTGKDVAGEIIKYIEKKMRSPIGKKEY